MYLVSWWCETIIPQETLSNNKFFPLVKTSRTTHSILSSFFGCVFK